MNAKVSLSELKTNIISIFADVQTSKENFVIFIFQTRTKSSLQNKVMNL